MSARQSARVRVSRWARVEQDLPNRGAGGGDDDDGAGEVGHGLRVIDWRTRFMHQSIEST